MEFIDPTLLGPDYIADTTHLDQGVWLNSDELNLEDMFTDNPYPELDSDYPAQPLEDANAALPQHPYMANGSSYFPQQPLMPPYQPGFNPGVWLAIESVSAPPYSPDYQPITPTISPAPQSPASLTPVPRRYTRRKGRAQTPEPPENPVELGDVVGDPAQPEKLEKPLSELVAGMPNYRAFDMDAFVRRDKSERMIKGKICRPNNGFILYRRAYDQAARFFSGGRGKAQNACRLLGMSWKMESDEVKKLFSNYARQEKDYHAYYFPSYKYNPRHGRPTARPTGRKPGRRAASKAASGIVGNVASDSEDDFIDDSDDDFKP
ncbi:hypothetical protein F5Y01DRAFT_320691 [Xylaria sp. FL0043]|nr:hypothetical protein F5Y01DRAFT_320691 [Xylaria sp. FL0043]